jgi:hypothetical protein
MNAGRRLLPVALVALVAGAAVAVPAGAGIAGQSPRASTAVVFQQVEFAVFAKGPVRGIVAASQRKAKGNLAISVSLEGLSVGTHYVVAGSSRSCAKPATKATTSFTVDLRTATTASTFTQATATAGATRTVRLLGQQGGGKFIPVACAVTVLDNEANLTAATATVAYHVGFSVFATGPVRGIVAGAQRKAKGKQKVTVSLNGLSPGTRYKVAGSSRSCAKAATKGTTTYTVNLGTTTSSSAFVQASRTAKPARSVRLFQAAGGKFMQTFCDPFVLGLDDG